MSGSRNDDTRTEQEQEQEIMRGDVEGVWGEYWGARTPSHDAWMMVNAHRRHRSALSVDAIDDDDDDVGDDDTMFM